jgi:hypothetical protein
MRAPSTTTPGRPRGRDPTATRKRSAVTSRGAGPSTAMRSRPTNRPRPRRRVDDAAGRRWARPTPPAALGVIPRLAAGRADLADHLAPVDREAAAVVAAIAAAGPRVVHRQVPQRLRRQRAVGDADAAGPTGLDQRGREAQVVGAGGGGQAGRAGAEDAQIVTSGHRAATVPR